MFFCSVFRIFAKRLIISHLQTDKSIKGFQRSVKYFSAPPVTHFSGRWNSFHRPPNSCYPGRNSLFPWQKVPFSLAVSPWLFGICSHFYAPQCGLLPAVVSTFVRQLTNFVGISWYHGTRKFTLSSMKVDTISCKSQCQQKEEWWGHTKGCQWNFVGVLRLLRRYLKALYAAPKPPRSDTWTLRSQH